MSDLPSTNGPDGRDARGRFAKGNTGGPGNPHARKVAQLRSALLRAVSAGDLRAVVTQLVDQAKAGDVQAARLLLDRLFGPAVSIDFEMPLSELEEGLARGSRSCNW